MDNLVTNIIELIKSKYTETMICEKFDEEVLNWVDTTVMEEEGLDEYEWYTDYGNGEAEDNIIYELIDEACRELNVEITSPEKIMAYEEIKSHYQCLNYF